MSENETVSAATETEEATENEESSTQTTTDADAVAAPAEEISYHAVEKDGNITAIWEMQGRKHLRTIDPRSRLGLEILKIYSSEHHE